MIFIFYKNYCENCDKYPIKIKSDSSRGKLIQFPQHLAVEGESLIKCKENPAKMITSLFLHSNIVFH